MLPSTQKREIERDRDLEDFQITLGRLQLLLGYIIIPPSCYPLCKKTSPYLGGKIVLLH